MEAVADHAGVAEACGDGEVCGDFRKRAVEGSVEAGELWCLGSACWAWRISVSDCGMCSGAKCTEAWSVERTSGVMRVCSRRCGPPCTTRCPTATGVSMRVLAKSREDRGERFGLRFEEVIAAEEIVAGGVADVQRAGGAADAVGAAFEEELFVCAALRARRIKPELERR